MAETSTVFFLEEWQTGAALILGSAIFGIAIGTAAGSVWDSTAGVLSFLVATIAAFVALSYLAYGR